MNIRKLDISAAIQSRRDVITDAVERALQSASKHHRKARVTVAFTAGHDKDAPHVLVLSSLLKVKEPKGPRIDVMGSSEDEELMRIDTGEAAGQQKIDD